MTDAPIPRSSSASDALRRKERISMAKEICSHRGENPGAVDRNGQEGWEKYEPLAGACIREAERLFALRAPAQGSPDCGDNESRMETISALIARLQSTLDRWGDTCVYIRRGGLSWGAVALNRRSDDEKNGVFDLQAQHDRDMLERLEQIERLKKDRDEWRQKVWDAEAKASSVSSTQRCTWPNCDQPSGHDYCYSHCLADRGAAVASTDGKSL